MAQITERFVDRYPTREQFISLIADKLEMFAEDGTQGVKLAFGFEMKPYDWKLIYYELYKSWKNHWFKSTDGELRDMRIAEKMYNEYPRLVFERALEEKLITQKDLSILLTTRTVANMGAHPATEPAIDSDEVLGFIDAQSASTQQNSIAELINTSFTNRSKRLDTWAQSFKSMFVSVFTSDMTPFFTRGEYDD
jgi:hypothetical protein